MWLDRLKIDITTAAEDLVTYSSTCIIHSSFLIRQHLLLKTTSSAPFLKDFRVLLSLKPVNSPSSLRVNRHTGAAV